MGKDMAKSGKTQFRTRVKRKGSGKRTASKSPTAAASIAGENDDLHEELFELFPRPLPTGVEELAELALDLRWTWSHAADALWRNLAPDIWERVRNPWLILQSISQRRLEEVAEDSAFRGELARLVRERREYLAAPTWCGERYGSADPQIAYFCMEYGLAESLPLYSGGLGILAGDHLKTASDLGICLTGVGLLYQVGYFRQMLDALGSQLDLYPINVPGSLPITPARDADGAWISVPLELPGRRVTLRLWHARVGRVSLYLLDSNDPLNGPADRGITARLYDENIETRLMQQFVLGVGGWRALQALGISPAVCHLNEGHAAFVTLERARQFMRDQSVGFREALWATRPGNVFTTHTPVAAAFDAYPVELLTKYGQEYAAQFGLPAQELLALGRSNSGNRDGAFNMAYLAAHTCGVINAVSQLHGQVSRRIFQPLFPRWPEREVPIGHVTNGVHVPSWDSRSADQIWTSACGKGRWLGSLDTLPPSIEELDDEMLWTLAGEERMDLVRYTRKRLAQQLAQRGLGEATVNEAARALDPNALTLGFARRFTAYKRPNLLLNDVERLARLLSNTDRPVQLIVAGKAHPRDEEGKRFVREWSEFTRRADVRKHAVFLEDYDIALAQELVQGVDLWINNPRRLWEACGTSGMKVLVNGGLNLSVRDGWWAEAYTPDVGWAFAEEGESSDAESDAVHACELYGLLERDIVPLFYERDANAIPRAWIARIRASLSQLAPRFSSNRMLQEYVDECYRPAAKRYAERSASGSRNAAELDTWARKLHERWDEVHFGTLQQHREDGSCSFVLQVYLGEISPDEVAVQLYADPGRDDEGTTIEMERASAIAGSANGFIYRATLQTPRPATDFTCRVVARHPQAVLPLEMNRILWWDGVRCVE
jgi:starch phosphorylase